MSQAAKPHVWAWASQHLYLVDNSKKLALTPSITSQEAWSQPGISSPIRFTSLLSYLLLTIFFPYFYFFFLDYRKVFVSTKPDLALLRNIFLTDSCLLVLMFILVSHSKHELPISKGSLISALPPTSWTFYFGFVAVLFCYVLFCVQFLLYHLT